jgi:hypothetical protein
MCCHAARAGRPCPCVSEDMGVRGTRGCSRLSTARPSDDGQRSRLDQSGGGEGAEGAPDAWLVASEAASTPAIEQPRPAAKRRQHIYGAAPLVPRTFDASHFIGYPV